MGAGCSNDATPGQDTAFAPLNWAGRRVLFLDVDGVLHPYACAIRHQFDKRCMAELCRVVKATGCAIVLSSAWRLEGGPLHTAGQALEKHGLPPVAGTTPDLRREGLTRVHEVLAWLERHPGVGAWAVVDDEELSAMRPEAHHISGRFVQTEKGRGLERRGGDALIAILSSKGGGG